LWGCPKSKKRVTPVPSIDRGIKIVRQLEQVFEAYCIMFQGVEGKNEAAFITIFLQRK
jgi:hypothetical protein